MGLFTSNKICKKIKDLYGLEYKSDKLIDWGFLVCYKTLSEEFIEEFVNYFKNDNHLDIVCKYQSLSENFIRKHKHEISWYEVSRHQILTPEFMKEFSNEIYWGEVSLFQPFIDPNHSNIIEYYYEENILSKLYQQTKERGWFVGYLEPGLEKENHFVVNIDKYDSFDNPIKKVRIYWKDLMLVDKVRSYELIREIKYVV